LAPALYNHAWELLEKADRTAAEDDEMLAAAFASRFHWGQVGGPSQQIFGDEHIARVCSYLGHGELAMKYASQALAATEATEGMPDFALAAAHETVARAAAAAGDRATRDRHVELGTKALDLIADDGDRAEIEKQLNTVP
jgi:hypothetical protein